MEYGTRDQLIATRETLAWKLGSKLHHTTLKKGRQETSKRSSYRLEA